MHQTLASFLDQEEDTVLAWQQELVSRPALGPENGGQGEQAKAEYLSTVLSELGFSDVRNLAAPDSRVVSGWRPNLTAVLPGHNQDRTLWIVSHMDVVPPGRAELWNTDPYTVHREGDRIYGRGVEDNHHGLVASLLAAKAFLRTGSTPAVNLGILCVADEETGNAYGLEYVFTHHAHIFGSDDQFLVPDFGRPDSSLIEVSEKGLMWLRLTVHGRQCHASTPQAGKNSLLAAAKCILRLQDLQSRFDRIDHLFDPPRSTFEPTKIEANVPNVNTIPGRDVFYCDCRVLPGYTLQEVRSAVEKCAQAVSEETGQPIDVDIVHQQEASSTDVQSPLVRNLQEAIAQVYGIRAEPQGIGGGTVAAYARRMGYPAAVWATLPGNAHQPNEWTSLRNTIQDAKVMTQLAMHPGD